jgi:hypothetical protein
MSNKVGVIGGSNHRKMKEAAKKIKSSTGYGGILGQSGGIQLKSGVAITNDEKDGTSKLKQVQDLLTYDTDGARSMRDIIDSLIALGANDKEFLRDLRNDFKFVLGFDEKLSPEKFPAQFKVPEVVDPNDVFTTRKAIPRIKFKKIKDDNSSSESFKPESDQSNDRGRQMHFVNVLNGNYTPIVSNIDEIAIFMNSIPTLEFSRCMPFLDVVFETGESALDREGNALSLSLYKSLEGASKPGAKSANATLAQSVPSNLKESGFIDQGKSTFGMEMFTTPQTLIPSTDGADGSRVEPILDQFRPFMSIKSFTVNLQPVAGGYYQKATGNLSIVLHDRSRLHEISALIRPDNYGSNHIFIEYGWIHPDADSGKNDYADFLNSLRRKSKWKLYNSDLRFTQNGEVEIDLSIIDLGDRNAELTSIDNNEYFKNESRLLSKIEKAVLKIAGRKGVGKEISPDLVDVSALGKSILAFNPKGLQKIVDKLEEASKNKNENYNASAKQLQEELVNFQRQRGKLTRATDDVIKLLFDNFTISNKKVSDPFLDAALEKSPDLGLYGNFTKVVGQVDGPGGMKFDLTEVDFAKVPYVSLGKVLGSLVGNPLLETGNYSEVQFYFYPFASRPSGEAFNAVGNLTTAEFLMDRNELREGVNYLMQTYRTADIPVEALIKFIMLNFVNFVGAPQYGLMNSSDEGYQKIVNGRRQSTVESVGKGETNVKKLNAAQKEKIKTINEKTSDFMFPKIALEFEAVPRIPTANESRKSAEKDTILRIHVYDTQAGRQEPYENLLNASLEGLNTLSAIKNTMAGRNKDAPASKPDARAKTLNRLIDELIKSNPKGLKVVREAGVDGNIQDFIIDLPYETIKKKIAGEYPFIEYGTEASAIIDASFRTNQNKDFVNVVLSQAGRNPERSASGLGSNGLPIFTKPNSLSMTTMGCPLLRYRTNMFIDFKTGTSVDNLYYARGVTHNISPGRFTTSLNMSSLLADGKYRSTYKTLKNAIDYIDKNKDDDTK